MNKIAITLTILILGGVFIFSQITKNPSSSATTNDSDSQPQVNSVHASLPDDSRTTSQTKLVDYSTDTLASTLENGNKAVLFFHANWCPTCKAAEKDILNNVSQIPEDIVILKANYDTERDLKARYEITTQHTFVYLDQNGEVIKKWNGGGVREIVSNTKWKISPKK